VQRVFVNILHFLTNLFHLRGQVSNPNGAQVATCQKEEAAINLTTVNLPLNMQQSKEGVNLSCARPSRARQTHQTKKKRQFLHLLHLVLLAQRTG